MLADMQALIRDPLVHFLAIGALLFALYAWRGDGQEDDATRIEVPAVQVQVWVAVPEK